MEMAAGGPATRLSALTSCTVQIPLLGQSGGSKAYAEDGAAFSSSPSGRGVGVRQSGAHRLVAPASLLCPLCIDGPGFDQRYGRLGLAQGLSLCVAVARRLGSIEGTKNVSP
jgi:hypothetical protein